jgi:biopolymer transport protein ExbD
VHALARAAVARDPATELQLRADKSTRYQTIAEVMSAAQSAGLTKLGFVTDPKAGGKTQAKAN